MLYLSQIQNQRIWDAFGRPVGRCEDVLVGHVDEAFPSVLAIAVRDGDATPAYIATDQVSSLYPSITLSVPAEQIMPYRPSGDELRLAARVLDRQIVDTEGRRVVRVNDVQLAFMRGHFHLTGVDVGGRGLLRRLGLEAAIQGAAGAFGKSLPEGVIPWEDVAPLNQDDPLRLRISRDKISQLPPADIAAILSDLDRPTGEALLRAWRTTSWPTPSPRALPTSRLRSSCTSIPSAPPTSWRRWTPMRPPTCSPTCPRPTAPTCWA